jgi:uncharacterized protein
MLSLRRGLLPSFFSLLLLWLAFAALGVQAQALAPIPELSSHVIDTSGTLTTDQQQALDGKLVAFETSNGSQVVVLMVPTTQPEDIASYANRVGSAWKIGRKDIGDGLLLIVAKNDRKLRIEVSRALEGAVPDLAAKRIIDQTITPFFKQGDFAGGIGAGLEQIMALIRGEALPAPQAAKSGSGSGDFQWMDLAVFLFFAVAVGGTILRNMLGSKLGSVVAGGAAGVIAFVVTTSVLVAILAGVVALVFSLVSGLGRFAQPHSRGPWGGTGGGGGWSSGSGGGFSSGGGGSFGGGGASGGW